mmetsp:Transcript_26101/g.60010  ORF Transcript_26101/g.60010 Transcript_26101/m.60010 type:complete len:98 (-) Transcript_26101:42-335(-)
MLKLLLDQIKNIFDRSIYRVIWCPVNNTVTSCEDGLNDDRIFVSHQVVHGKTMSTLICPLPDVIQDAGYKPKKKEHQYRPSVKKNQPPFPNLQTRNS